MSAEDAACNKIAELALNDREVGCKPFSAAAPTPIFVVCSGVRWAGRAIFGGQTRDLSLKPLLGTGSGPPACRGAGAQCSCC